MPISWRREGGEGEGVATTVVRLSEVANVLEDVAGLNLAISFAKDTPLKRNVAIEDVGDEDYVENVLLAEERGVSINGALAHILVEKRVKEIYAFDKHLENLNVKALID
ncbi:TPA: VapC toxin family PIN domain ribonuclease [Candidatus Bathyarchaeota archaeon]|nr:VapC toxin family PIN domain ribonuclease [Candidatus Bathyarchaeota archaeon]